ncbi:cation:proton antiporter [Helicobacter sp. 11-8110]|uniref:cation:proton antiporter domain-containing protein n=1 Tax=Helicobacter sp. 11-8110 TaxID=2004997 RepID=UPI00215C4EDE|nr:cation:proton antiporter [Helicobacter sp. 11-8110]
MVCVFAMAVISGIILNKLKIPTIIGYIVTGVLTAYIFDFRVEDSNDLSEIAEMGIVFLMFMIGLDFSFKKMSSIKQEVFLFGGLQIGLSILVFFFICYSLFGFNFDTSIIVASAISLSSTAIVLKYLNEVNQTKTSYGIASVGILIFQDLAVIPILLMIKLLSSKDLAMSDLLLTTGISAFIVVLLLLLPGRFLAKIILRSSAKMKTDEIFVGTVFLIVLGSAFLSQSFGFSMTLGAFLSGMIISSTSYKYQVASVLVYFRDLLLGIFFITIGMQVDIIFLAKYFIIIILLVFLTLLAKTLIMFAFLSFFRGTKIAMKIALSLSQIGEFSFAIFLLASQHEILNLQLDGGILKHIFGTEFFASITPVEIHQFLTLMVIFSMIATPFILDNLDKCTAFALKAIKIPQKNPTTYTQEQQETKEPKETKKRILICGYGLVGQKIFDFLKDYDIEVFGIDSNYERVEKGIIRGDKIIYGNITDKMIFREVEIQKVTAVILCIESPVEIEKACRHILALSKYTKIIVQTRDNALELELKAMGLYGVINSTMEIATILSNLAIETIKEAEDEQEKSAK